MATEIVYAIPSMCFLNSNLACKTKSTHSKAKYLVVGVTLADATAIDCAEKRTSRKPEQGSMFKLELEYPPTINHQFSFRQGRPVLSKDARAYRQTVRRQLMLAKVKPMMGKIAVQIELFPPDARRRDCDNVQKPILDALQQAGAFWDDSQVVWLLTIKSEPVSGGKAIVTISEIEEVRQPFMFSYQESLA
jgi:crossover junction endodeoxyribonuclease RusA